MRLVPVVLLVSGVAFPASADTRPEIRAVTLSTAGLAMIEAEGQLGPDGLRLPIRRADIDDFLKSLRLADPENGVPMVTMTGPGGVSDVFAALPFDPEDLGDLRALLGAMTGAPVVAERRGTTLSGVVMGTRDVPCALEGQRGCVALALRTEGGGIRQIALDEALDLSFADSADQDAVARGLAAMRASSRALVLDVSLTSSVPEPRDVGLGWLQPAPIWKTAWRAEDSAEGLFLTGWAVVENSTGQDWDAIELTLATGAVQALQAQLYDRLEPARKLARPEMDAEMMAAAPMARGMVLESQMDVAPVSMDDGESFSRFTLSTPVTLQAGDMISLPFLRERLEDARLTLHHGGSGAEHPVIAIEFENPLPLRLPAGIVTLYEDGRGHAGDAMIPELAPGAREVIEFARDTAMRIRESVDEDARVQSARIVNGVLHSEERVERRTSYRIEGAPDADRMLTLMHPLRAGWEIVSAGGETGFDATRFDVDVPVGQIVTQEVLEARALRQEIALLPLDGETLAYWSNRMPDPELRQILRNMQSLRALEAALREEIEQTAAREAELIADQERLAGLIVQLGDDSPATRERRARVDAIDTELENARLARRAAENRLARITEDLRALIEQS